MDSPGKRLRRLINAPEKGVALRKMIDTEYEAIGTVARSLKLSPT